MEQKMGTNVIEDIKNGAIQVGDNLRPRNIYNFFIVSMCGIQSWVLLRQQKNGYNYNEKHYDEHEAATRNEALNREINQKLDKVTSFYGKMCFTDEGHRAKILK